MDLRSYGITRREIRSGAGAGEEMASEHFDELVGSVELSIYRHPNRKIKGYEALKQHVESQGCQVAYNVDSPTPFGKGYATIKITNAEEEIPVPALKRAHNWAHQRNLPHLFQKKGRKR